MQQGYTGPEVCKITGISYRQLDHWTTTKLIKASVRNIENNSSKKIANEPNLIQEEISLSQTIGFKTKISYSKSGKGNIKIFYNNLEQYNFLINKLKN